MPADTSKQPAHVTIADLDIAAQWLEIYESAPGMEGEDEAAAKRVAAWLRAEMDRRFKKAADAQFIKQAVKQGHDAAKARKFLKKNPISVGDSKP